MILVTFSPKLNELDVKKEALRMFEKKCEMEAIQTEQSAMQEAKENVSFQPFLSWEILFNIVQKSRDTIFADV